MQPERDPSHCKNELLITDPKEIGRLAMELAAGGEVIDQHIDEFEDGPYSHLREALYERIIGQDEAVDALIDTLNDSEFADPDKPIGTFMFLGPTGVGKSQLTKEIARLLHGGSSKGYQSINCTQLKSNGDVTMLQGAPLGYIGYGDKTVLDQEKLMTPKNVLVFDEIEKAHSTIHDYLMQILDEGEITLFNTREKVSLKESIVILTSNAGSRDINEQLGKTYAGFKDGEDEAPAVLSKEKLSEVALGALDKSFRPEFLGRIKNKLLFTHLTDEHHGLALKQYEREINERDPLKKIGVTLETTPELRDLIVQMTARRNVGGFREVRTTFENEIERTFIKLIRNGKIPHRSVAYAAPASDSTKENNPNAIVEFRADTFSA